MTHTSEAKMTQRYTDHRLLCPNCQRNNNFELVVKQDGNKYYLGEKCPRCEHFEDFKLIPSRIAQDYLPSNKATQE